MTRSFKSDKERSKSSTMLGATSRPKKGGSGAGKHNWGNERDEILDGMSGAQDGTALSSSPPTSSAFHKVSVKASP